MFGLHQPEQEFWRRANPARLHRLFDSWYKEYRPPAQPKVIRAKNQEKIESLSSYLNSMGVQTWQQEH
jgi:hypothetical protein